jgi:iron complex outermembrane receptor protein
MPFNVKIGLTHKLGGFSNTLEAQYVADKDDTSNVRNEIHTDSYNLFHLRSSYEWKQVRLDFGIENIFDKNYSLPLGGAYVGQGTTMSANAIPWGIAVPGPGRSVYAGVNFSF